MAIKPTLNLAIKGTQINPDPYNENFNMMLDYIDDTVNELNTFVQSQVNGMNNKVTNLRMIGQPILRLNDVLQSDEIRLEGAEVSRTTYASLFSIYGTTYGEGDGSTTFKLPDFRNRALWGANRFGYLVAGLPNITGSITQAVYGAYGANSQRTGAFSGSTQSTTTGTGNPGQLQGGPDHNGSFRGNVLKFDASHSNSIYGKSNTVQPPAIKIRVVTRYK